ncbi:endo-1,4-beta-xylanase [Marinilabilia sp.]|uniref:endo-1,4-beta-xylanase n=1 Tax=Marinilabilia sp. TaxID=2021252 RepID=UPI0025BCDD7F|nr:endo-1,4-beta-xylanase [Marinilabilia sp.]
MNRYKKQIVTVFALGLLLSGCNNTPNQDISTFKDAFAGKFLVGAAINVGQIAGQEPKAIEIVKKQFNSVVAENCMKMENIHPEEEVFIWEEADAFVDFAEKNNMHIVGHTLVWHSQAAPWIFVDDSGEDVSREELIERMKNHIQTIVGRYKGRIDGWDVVNEAIENDGSWRESKWYQIIGPEYVELAFQFAQEADPEAELYYNDFGVSGRSKCDGIYHLVKNLQEKNVKVDGIGLQGHLNFDIPKISEMETSIEKLSSLGVDLMVTEVDMTILPWPSDEVTAEVSLNYELSKEFNPYSGGLPDSVYQQVMDRYTGFFEMFLKHHEKISRVTFWGVHDGNSWRNDWPIEGRTDFPLLFDRNYRMKEGVEDILEMAENWETK